jgi:hypothetical protein
VGEGTARYNPTHRGEKEEYFQVEKWGHLSPSPMGVSNVEHQLASLLETLAKRAL